TGSPDIGTGGTGGSRRPLRRFFGARTAVSPSPSRRRARLRTGGVVPPSAPAPLLGPPARRVAVALAPPDAARHRRRVPRLDPFPVSTGRRGAARPRRARPPLPPPPPGGGGGP